MKRLTVDTDLPFCDIAKCDFIPGGSFCEDGRCDQRRCYEKLREYERSDLEPETLRKAQGLLKELKDARQTVELMDACGKRVCSSEEHWGCRRSQRCSARKERRTGHRRTPTRRSWSCSERNAAA